MIKSEVRIEYRLLEGSPTCFQIIPRIYIINRMPCKGTAAMVVCWTRRASETITKNLVGYVPVPRSPTEPQKTVWRRFWGHRAIIITSIVIEIYIVIAKNYKNNIHIVSYTYAAFRHM